MLFHWYNKGVMWIRRFLLLSLILFLSVSLGCARNDATGKRQFNIVSDEEEMKLGKAGDDQIRKEYGVYRDPKLQAYVTKIGQHIVGFSGRSGITYHFTVLDSPIINAFALPGGYIYVTRGLLAQLNSEAELAFVIGHEISHVAARHGAQRLSQYRGVVFVNVLASIFAKDFSDNWGGLVNKGVELSVRGYGRDNEFEADLLGAQYVYEAYYHPEEFDDFFYTLKRQEKYESNWLQNLHASHPPTTERIERLQKKVAPYIEKEGSAITAFQIKRKEYLEMIKGIFVGKGSVLGHLKGRQYENIAYGMAFVLPSTWTVKAATDPKALLDFKGKKSPLKMTLYIENPSPAYSIKKSVGHYLPLKARKLGHKTINYPYASAYQTRYSLYTEAIGRTVEISTYYLHENKLYRFVCNVQRSSVASVEKELNDFFSSFGFMSKQRLDKEGAYHLVIHEVKKGDTLKSISDHYGLKDGVQRLIAFNGFSKEPTFSVGDLIKIPSH